jgi:hypothetical protein
MNDLPFELQIALRYLLAKRKQAFISVISFISTLGVTVGVMALVVALALMTGLQQELRDRIVGSNPHIYVWNTRGIDDYTVESAKLRTVPHVVRVCVRVRPRARVRPRPVQEAARLGVQRRCRVRPAVCRQSETRPACFRPSAGPCSRKADDETSNRLRPRENSGHRTRASVRWANRADKKSRAIPPRSRRRCRAGFSVER